MAVPTMHAAKPNTSDKSIAEPNPSSSTGTTTFRDFMGVSCCSDAPLALASDVIRPSETSVSSGIGGRGPNSTTSDLGSERQIGSHLEGVPFYGPRSDISGPDTSNRIVGSKRSNSDSSFMVSSRDGIPPPGPDFLEGSHLVKMVQRGTKVEQLRRSTNEELFYGMHQFKPTSASPILQTPGGSKSDAGACKWERAVALNASPVMQYHPRATQLSPFVQQIPPNRFKETNICSSIASQTAADEGSRTGIKGSGLSSINAKSGVSERTSSIMLPGGSRSKSWIHIAEPEGSTTPSPHRATSASRQMTVFYAGQAHVFDDVHPNKADVIMALAGSNGGSWSTTYLPKSNLSQFGENYSPNMENEAGISSNAAFSREHHWKSAIIGNAKGVSSVGHQGGSLVTKDTRNVIQAVEPAAEQK